MNFDVIAAGVVTNVPWDANQFQKWIDEDKWTDGRREALKQSWDMCMGIERLRREHGEKFYIGCGLIGKQDSQPVTCLEVFKLRRLYDHDYVHILEFGEYVALYKSRKLTLEKGEIITATLTMGEPIEVPQDCPVVTVKKFEVIR